MVFWVWILKYFLYSVLPYPSLADSTFSCLLCWNIFIGFISWLHFTVWTWWKKYTREHCCCPSRHAIQWSHKFWNCIFVKVWVLSNATSCEWSSKLKILNHILCSPFIRAETFSSAFEASWPHYIGRYPWSFVRREATNTAILWFYWCNIVVCCEVWPHSTSVWSAQTWC